MSLKDIVTVESGTSALEMKAKSLRLLTSRIWEHSSNGLRVFATSEHDKTYVFDWGDSSA